LYFNGVAAPVAPFLLSPRRSGAGGAMSTNPGIIGVLLLLFGTCIAAIAVLWIYVPMDDDEPVVINGEAVAPLPKLDAGRIAVGGEVYARHCASCHRSDLNGASNWRMRQPDGSHTPPALNATGYTWQMRDQIIINIIKQGVNPNSPKGMPAYAGKLSDAEVVAVMDFLKSHWDRPNRKSQWWQTQLNQELPAGVEPTSIN